MAETNGATFSMTMPSEREIVMTRIFDAPRELVFEAHTKPEHLTRWWGPRGFTLPGCEMDFRPGGTYRFVSRGPDGAEYVFKGEYREIVPPERLVNTFEWEGTVSVETLTLEEQDGKTKLTSISIFETVQDRDAMQPAEMERGAKETWDRLEEHVRTMAKNA